MRELGDGAAAALGIIADVRADAVDVNTKLRYAFALNDDAVVFVARFKIESVAGTVGFLEKIVAGTGIFVAVFFIPRLQHLDAKLIPVGFRKNFKRIQHHGDAALHVERAGSGNAVAVCRKGALRRRSVRKHRIKVSDEYDKGLRRVFNAFFGDEEVPRRFVFMKTYFEADRPQKGRDVFAAGVHSGFVAGAAVAVNEAAPRGENVVL